MKYSLYFVLILLVSCSSQKKDEKEFSANSSGKLFKKQKPLKLNEVPDFYLPTVKSLNPALADETLDRFSGDELSKMSDSPDPLIQISILCSNNNFDSAFKVASKVFDAYQKIPQYWNLVANCHLNQGSSRKALLFYNKALEVSANYVPALNNIGVMYSRQGQEQKALVAFERASKFSKFSKTPRYNLAKLYLSYGLVDLAQPIFEGLLNSSSKDVDLLNALATCYFLNSNYQKSVSLFEKIPKEYWSNPEIGLNFSISLKKVNRLKDAKTLLSNIRTPDTDSLKRYYRIVESKLGE